MLFRSPTKLSELARSRSKASLTTWLPLPGSSPLESSATLGWSRPSMGRLAEGIRRKKNTVTTLVRKLEAAGYVTCGKDKNDSRVTLVAPTAKAEAFRAEFLAISRSLLDRVWAGVPEAEREALMRTLARLEANLG